MNAKARKLEDVEHQLKISEIRYRRLFETAKDGILILDASTGKIIDANPFMTKMLGYDFSYFIGKELWEIGLFKDKESSKEAYEELKKNGYISFADMPLKTHDNKKIEVEFVSNIYEETDGKLVAQCNIRDITLRRMLEEQSKAQTVMLADASRRKDEFLALLAHELRNPLAPLSSALHLLQLPNISEKSEAEVYAIMERQINQLVHIVDDLLDMARSTTQTIELRLEKAHLADIVQGAVETSKPLLDAAGHKLTVLLPGEPIELEVDSVRIIQVLTNILNNAAKFTPKHGLITISAERKDTDAVIRIKDNGIGIDADMMPYIFDMFTKVDTSMSSSQGGLGIGLALVKSIVELHNGKVTAYSAGLGQGAQFTVWLPLVQKRKNSMREIT